MEGSKRPPQPRRPVAVIWGDGWGRQLSRSTGWRIILGCCRWLGARVSHVVTCVHRRGLLFEVVNGRPLGALGALPLGRSQHSPKRFERTPIDHMRHGQAHHLSSSIEGPIDWPDSIGGAASEPPSPNLNNSKPSLAYAPAVACAHACIRTFARQAATQLALCMRVDNKHQSMSCVRVCRRPQPAPPAHRTPRLREAPHSHN